MSLHREILAELRAGGVEEKKPAVAKPREPEGFAEGVIARAERRLVAGRDRERLDRESLEGFVGGADGSAEASSVEAAFMDRLRVAPKDEFYALRDQMIDIESDRAFEGSLPEQSVDASEYEWDDELEEWVEPLAAGWSEEGDE